MGSGLKPDAASKWIIVLLCCDSMTQESLEGFQKNLMWINRCFKHWP